MRARVFVTLKPSVFDPQGKTVTDALHSIGYQAVRDVRQGKYFELDIDAATADEGSRLAGEAADKLLANPVIESYRIEIDGIAAAGPRSATSRCSGGRRAVKFAVVVFPGSNCDHDAHYAASQVFGQDAALVWHKDTSLGDADAVILPGGFAYGDYLRTGAIARFSPIMAAVRQFADAGGPVLGICNGFQVLLEAGLLPGAMLRNRSVQFHCEHVHVRVEQTDTPFTGACRAPARCCACRSPTARATTTPSPMSLPASRRNRQVVFRYVTAAGEMQRRRQSRTGRPTTSPDSATRRATSSA